MDSNLLPKLDGTFIEIHGQITEPGFLSIIIGEFSTLKPIIGHKKIFLQKIFINGGLQDSSLCSLRDCDII